MNSPREAGINLIPSQPRIETTRLEYFEAVQGARANGYSMVEIARMMCRSYTWVFALVEEFGDERS